MSREEQMSPCQHESVQFNSGDYYVACHACGARWGRIHYSQPEYGAGMDGRQIGCTPERANQGFNDTDQFRHRNR